MDCQSASVPDLKELSFQDHDALVLDEISGVQFAIDNTRLLQSHIDGAKLGQSATQMYAYDVWWWRKPIILTTNNWASSLAALETTAPQDHQWLAQNVLVVTRTEQLD